MTRQGASEKETNLAIALIGAALAVLVGVILAAFGIIDKLSPFGSAVITTLGASGVVLLLASAIAGGRGISYGIRPGPWNAFDIQAKAGLLAVIVLLAAPIAGIFLLRADKDSLSSQMAALRKENLALERTILKLDWSLHRQNSGFDNRLRRIESRLNAGLLSKTDNGAAGQNSRRP
jgi:hypothetical protein